MVTVLLPSEVGEAVFPGNSSDIIRIESPIFSLACRIFPSGNVSTPSFFAPNASCKNQSPRLLPFIIRYGVTVPKPLGMRACPPMEDFILFDVLVF